MLRAAAMLSLFSSASGFHASRRLLRKPRGIAARAAAGATKKELRKDIMQKEDFIRSPQAFKAEKATVDAMMLAEFKVRCCLPQKRTY